MFGDEERELLENADARAAIKLARALLDKSLHPACPAGRPAPHAISRPRCEAHTLPTKIDFLACVNAPDAQTGLFLTHRKKQDPSIWRRDQSSCFSPLPRLFLSVTPLAFICRQVSHSLSRPCIHACLSTRLHRAPALPRAASSPYRCTASRSFPPLPLACPHVPASTHNRARAGVVCRTTCAVCVCVCVFVCARVRVMALSPSLALSASLPLVCVCVCVDARPHTHRGASLEREKQREARHPSAPRRIGAAFAALGPLLLRVACTYSSRCLLGYAALRVPSSALT